MKKQIYRAISFFALISIALTAIALCFFFYGGWLSEERAFYYLTLRALTIAFCVWIASSIIIGVSLAEKLAERISKPINDADLEGEFIPPYDEIVPFARAIAERRARLLERLNDFKERSEAISSVMENMNEGAVLLDGGGTILSANKSALRIFGMEDVAMQSRNIIELLRDKALLEGARAALAGTRSEIDAERGERHYRAYFSPAAGAGAILLFLDITERMKAEKLRREFSANVSHELKTPLTSILGYAELLLGGAALEEDKPQFYQKIKFESERLLALIEDIMELSKLDEGKKGEFEKLDISELAREAAESLSQKASKANVTLEVIGTGFFINANRSMMTELFYNLIDNAIKYNKPGGSAVTTFSRKDGRVSASVSDTGIGIPKESLERIFERFYRVDKSRSKKTGGTGLGLAIAKHVAIIHGAEIIAESREGEGTAVTVVFAELEED